MALDPERVRQHNAVLRLNEEYVRASLAGDVAWYDARLAEDFVCIDSDGSVLDKAAFLDQTPRGLTSLNIASTTSMFTSEDGDVALVRALGVWTKRSGTPGT